MGTTQRATGSGPIDGYPSLRARDFVKLSVPRPLKKDHRRKGGRKLQRWACYLNRGVIRVMAGTGTDGLDILQTTVQDDARC